MLSDYNQLYLCLNVKSVYINYNGILAGIVVTVYICIDECKGWCMGRFAAVWWQVVLFMKKNIKNYYKYIIVLCFLLNPLVKYRHTWFINGCHGCDRMVVGFTTTCAISAYHYWSFEFEYCSWRGVLDTTLCDKVCQWLVKGRWFSLVSSTNKTDFHDINIVESGIKHHKPIKPGS